MAEEYSKRERKLGGDRAKLSNWHFGYKESSKAPELNDRSEINIIGQRYAKTKDENDADTLLRAFNPYLMKYLRLLTTGKISDEHGQKRIHKDTRRFLALFSTNGKRSSDTELIFAAKRLPNAFASMEADDIYNELVVIFMDLINKFDGRGTITGFVQHRFGWAVKNRMFAVQRDPLNYQPLYEDQSVLESQATSSSTEDLGEFVRIRESESCYNVPETLSAEWLDIPKLNPSFITDPPKPYGVLWTKVQRTVVVMRLHQGICDSTIASILGLGSAANVRAVFDEAVDIIKKMTELPE